MFEVGGWLALAIKIADQWMPKTRLPNVVALVLLHNGFFQWIWKTKFLLTPTMPFCQKELVETTSLKSAKRINLVASLLSTKL